MKVASRAALLACVLSLPLSAPGDVFFRHVGDNDPRSEGWDGDGTTPIEYDMGFSAWAADGSDYRAIPTIKQVAQATKQGWRLAARVRVTTAAHWGGAAFWYGNGENRWLIDLVLNDTGALTVTAVTEAWDWSIGYQYLSDGEGYHLYEVIYDTTTGTADVFVDGVERISDWAGNGYNERYCGWGGGSGLGDGGANWNWVSLSSGSYQEPPPATVLGDANRNGFVDDSDLAILLSNWEQDPLVISTWGLGNFTESSLGDTDVDDVDLAVLLGNWTGAPPAGVSVPEPATLSLLALGGLAVMRRRRR